MVGVPQEEQRDVRLERGDVLFEARAVSWAQPESQFKIQSGSGGAAVSTWVPARE